MIRGKLMLMVTAGVDGPALRFPIPEEYSEGVEPLSFRRHASRQSCRFRRFRLL